MTLSYVARFWCVSLASFYIAQFVLGVAVLLSSPGAARAMQSGAARTAARFLLCLRVLPALGATAIVLMLCVPSYLRLEANRDAEQVSLLCIAAAALAVVTGALSIVRSVKAAAKSRIYLRRCRESGTQSPHLLVIETAGPVLALSGIFRPVLIISRSVLDALSTDELDAALLHEAAHRASRDNLKRLAVLLAPDVIPFVRSFSFLEREWVRFTERAADDRAVASDGDRRLSLASALLRVARLGVATKPIIATGLLGDPDDLSARVQRLLEPLPVQSNEWLLSALATTAAAALFGIVFAHSTLLLSIHELIERLV